MRVVSFPSIGDVVAQVSTWTPERDEPDGEFIYIDLSAVDQDSKLIAGPRHLACTDAPSRASQLVRSGDVLVSTVRPSLNAVARVPEELDGATASTGFCVLRPRPDMADGGYLFHWVRSPRFVGEMVRRATGASYPAVSDRIVCESRIPLPPLPEQRRIAEILDKADALRAKRRAVLAQLDTLTQSIFLDMFGDSATNPKGWPEVSVGEYVAEFQGGRSMHAETDGPIPTRNRVLKVSAVTGMQFRPGESKPLPDSYSPPVGHFVRPGDLLFSRANTTDLVGAVAFVHETPSNVLLPDKLWRFVWRQPVRVEPLFVWMLFQSTSMRYEIGRRATGTSGSMKNISQEKVLGIRSVLPPLEVQRAFVRRFAGADALRDLQATALASGNRIFASLQHRAFRGDL